MSWSTISYDHKADLMWEFHAVIICAVDEVSELCVASMCFNVTCQLEVGQDSMDVFTNEMAADGNQWFG